MRDTKIIPATLMVFNLSFEPSSIYSLDMIAEKGWEENQFVSYKLKANTLYLESDVARYELSLVQEVDSNNPDDIFEEQDRFRWGQVKQPVLFKDNKFMDEAKVPLDEENLEIIYSDLEWSDVEWDSKYIYVKGEQVGPLKCFKFLPNHEASSI